MSFSADPKYIHDQPPFLEALLYHRIKIYTLQSIYNARTPYPFSMIARPVKIIHGRHRDYLKVAQKLNRHSGSSRIWFPRFQVVVPYRRTIFFNLYMKSGPVIKKFVKGVLGPIVSKFGLRDYI